MVQPLAKRYRNENMRSMPFTFGRQPLPSVQLKPTKPKMRTMRARSLRTERSKWRRSSRLSFMPRKKGLNSPYPLCYPLLLSRDKRLSVHSPLALSMYDSHGDSTSRWGIMSASKWKLYSSYKESVERESMQIPSHWNMIPNRHLMKLRKLLNL